MEKGYKEYGDKSFSQSPDKLCAEVIEELYDILGWGCILIDRLEHIKKHIKKLEVKDETRQ